MKNRVSIIIAMKMSEGLQLKLRKKFEPSSTVKMKYRGNDLSIRTDADGNAILMFIGKGSPDGKIKGARYSRTLKHDANGVVIKDHWDLKGKAT